MQWLYYFLDFFMRPPASVIRVLVIDDDSDMTGMIKIGLEKNGKFEVLTAATPTEGIQAAKWRKPDIILLDWQIPEMSGIGILSRLQHSRRTYKIPIFMLTAHRTLEHFDAACSRGAVDYFVKPLKIDTIAERLIKFRSEKK